MRNAFLLHVGANIKQLRQEKPSRIFAHSTDGLTEIEQKATRDVLKHYVHELLNFTSGWFLDEAICSVALDLDNIWMLKAEKNLDLLLHISDRFFVLLQELLLDQLKC